MEKRYSLRIGHKLRGGGGYKTGGGGAREVLPLRKGGRGVLTMLKVGGHKKSWGSFYTVACSLSHIKGAGGGGGSQQVLPWLDTPPCN